MAKSKGFSFRKKRQAAPPDELGGFMDGGLAILDVEGNRVHVTPSKVAASLRYFLARVQLHDSDGLPTRLAVTSARHVTAAAKRWPSTSRCLTTSSSSPLAPTRRQSSVCSTVISIPPSAATGLPRTGSPAWIAR